MFRLDLGLLPFKTSRRPSRLDGTLRGFGAGFKAQEQQQQQQQQLQTLQCVAAEA